MDRWTTLIAVPGILFVTAVLAGSVLGHRRALDLAELADRVQESTAGDTAGTVVLVALFALAATGAGLAAQILGAGQLLWWLGVWPGPVRGWSRRRTTSRRERWARAQAEFADALRDGDLERASAAGVRRNRLSRAEPVRPTGIGDRVAAVETRVLNAYGLDLPSVWPRLWLLLPDVPQAEIRAARTRIDEASVLSAWGVMYLALGFVWWPALVAGAVVWTVGWLTARPAVDAYADLVESAVDLHGVSLAQAFGLEVAGTLTPEAGRAVTRRVRKGA